MFFMAEYMNMITVSALATTLFLGGWHAPLPFNLIPALDQGWWGLLWFVLKVLFFLFIFVWLRGTLPRLRYDQFMSFGWKYLIPIALVWLMAVAAFRLGNREGWFSTPVFWIVAGLILVGLIVLTFVGGAEEHEPPDVAPEEPFDAFAGGYPVPPQGNQQLPELAGVLVGEESQDVPPPRRARPMPAADEQTTREEQS
jgi:NADH-quinone oxidoreductase subunit H